MLFRGGSHAFEVGVGFEAPAERGQHGFRMGERPEATGLIQPLLRPFLLADQGLQCALGFEASILLARCAAAVQGEERRVPQIGGWNRGFSRQCRRELQGQQQGRPDADQRGHASDQFSGLANGSRHLLMRPRNQALSWVLRPCDMTYEVIYGPEHLG